MTAEAPLLKKNLIQPTFVSAFYGFLGLAAVVWTIAAAGPAISWPAVLTLGVLARLSLTQGLPVFGYRYSLELSIYLFGFLVFSLPTAFLSISLCSLLYFATGVVKSPPQGRLDLTCRRLSNILALGLALFAAARLYDASGGTAAPLHLTYAFPLALAAFWVAFTFVNNLVFAPLALLRKGWKAFPSVIQALWLDGLLNGISVLAGAGFSLVFTQHGWGALGLLAPVLVLLMVFLKRTSDRGQGLSAQRKMLEDLNRLTSDLHKSLHLPQVTEALERACQELFTPDSTFAALLDERAAKVQFVGASREGRPIHLEDARLDQGLSGQVLRTGKPLFIADAVKDPGAQDLPGLGAPFQPARSIMMVPLMDKGRAFGVVSVHHARPNVYEPFHQEVMLALAQHAAAAVTSARLYQRAIQDGLTRLYNRSYFEESVSAHLAEGRAFGLLFLDCDDFKSLNDRFGHPVGDRTLDGIGAVIREHCRADDVPCRYGGDEFAVLLHGASAAQTRSIAERMKASIAGMRLDGPQGPVATTVSIGTLWCDGTREGLPVGDLLKEVDRSLYAAKRRKNAVDGCDAPVAP